MVLLAYQSVFASLACPMVAVLADRLDEVLDTDMAALVVALDTVSVAV